MTVVTDNEVERVARAIGIEFALLQLTDEELEQIARAALAASDRDVLVAALRKIAEMTDIEADFDGFEAREIAVAALLPLGGG